MEEVSSQGPGEDGAVRRLSRARPQGRRGGWRRLFRVRNGGLGARCTKPEAAGAGSRRESGTGGRVCRVGPGRWGISVSRTGRSLAGSPRWRCRFSALPHASTPHPPPSAAAAAILSTLTTVVAHFLRAFPPLERGVLGVKIRVGLETERNRQLRAARRPTIGRNEE